MEANIPPAKKKNSGLKALAITGAWLTLPSLGVILFTFTSLVSAALVATYTNEYDIARFFVFNGLLGALILGIIILAVWRVRKRTYAWHLLIGLWIGLGLYIMMLCISGLIAVSFSVSQLGTGQSAVCTTAEDQLLRNQAAIIPIETDLGSGSGFAIDANGTVLTAYHVVEGADDVYANYADGKQDMTVVKTSAEYDIALLKIDTETPHYFQLTSTYEAVDKVYALGYPWNSLDAGPASVSGGIISRVMTTEDLRLNDSETPDGLEIIQTDAAINAGNSGGPLVGRCGVVGIISSVSDASELSDYIGVVSEQGIGYAISAKTAAEKFRLPLANSY
jgi:S1-C subfamily serine protease